MPRMVESPRSGSPPAGLRPAPLRIPVRKTAAGLNERPGAALDTQRQRARDAYTTTLSRTDLSQHPQANITRVHSHRRRLGPKLQSLKSRFELLHAVNSADTCAPQHPASSQKPGTSTIPRAVRPDKNLRRNILTPSPVESISRASSDLSPCQVRTPPAPDRKSRLPVSEQPIIRISNATTRAHTEASRKWSCAKVVDNLDMEAEEQKTSRPSTSYFTSHSTVSSIDKPTGDDPGLVADRRKLFEENSTYPHGNASTIPVLRHARPFITPRGSSLHQLPKSKSSRNNYSSLEQPSPTITIFPQTGEESSPNKTPHARQETSLDPGEGSKILAASNVAYPQQRLSVADLRRSFEQLAQPSRTSGGGGGSELRSKASRHSMRQNRDMAPSASSKLRMELLPDQPSMLPEGTSRLRRPLFSRGQIVDVKPRIKGAEQTPPPTTQGGPVRRGPSPSLPRSRKFDLKATHQGKTDALHNSTKSERLSRPTDQDISQKWGSTDGLEFSTDGLSGCSYNERLRNSILMETPKFKSDRLMTEDAPGRSPLRLFRTPRFLSPGNRPMQGSGKVSQLRKFFERSSNRFTSPPSPISPHSKPGPAESVSGLKYECSSPYWNNSGSPTSTHTVARRRSIVPSLTTEISVNDFSCEFVGSPVFEGTLGPKSPSETAAGVEPDVKRESPVKHRIQQFERISRDSLKLGGAPDRYTKINDSQLSSGHKTRKRGGGKRNSWKPVQRGAAIWRKISNSFSFSLDSWRDCDSDHEHLNPTEGIGSETCFDRSPSLPNDPWGYHSRASSFGYIKHRAPTTNAQFISSSQTVPGMQLGVGNSLNTHPERASNANYDCLSPDIPPSPRLIKKRHPFATRVSGGFRRPSGLGFGFGLDGHFPSKLVREEELQPTEARSPGPSTPQGDPNALLQVMLKQSAAERSRRRQDDKHLSLRRDIKSRTLARWKGKGKADVDLRSADGTILTNAGTGGKLDKGKGKGKETGAETNKKTESGFVIFESKDVKLRHPKPRRPGQVRKLANMYRDKGSSGVSVNTKASSGATLKESRLGFRQKASSAFGFKTRKGSQAG